MEKKIQVFVIPVIVLLAGSLFYFVYISSFNNYGLTNNRFLSVLDFYEEIPEGSVLFFGDSQVREDIDCNTLNCYNLGISGILPLQLALQRQMIEATNPSKVYLGISPLLFSESANVNDDLYMMLNGRIDFSEDAFLYQELSEAERELLTMGPLDLALAKRKFILSHYTGLLKGMFSDEDVRVSTENFKDPWQYSEPHAVEDLFSKMEDPEIMAAFEFSLASMRQRQAFEYLVKSLTDSDIEVVLVAMPLNPLALNEVSYSVVQFESYVSTLESRYDVIVKDYTWSYSEEMFVDLTHQSSEGRALISDDIAGGDADTIQ